MAQQFGDTTIKVDTINELTSAAGVTIDGVLIKDSEVTVADEVYGSGWDGSLEVPTKNAVYDKIEAIPALADGDKGDITVSSSGTVWSLDAATVGLTELSATGTPSSSTYLRGDNTWATVAGTGDVSKVGTPVNNQVGVWTGDGTLEGDTALTFDTTTDTLATTDLSLSNDLLLSSGSVINFNAGDVTITHSANALVMSGGTLQVPQMGIGIAPATLFHLSGSASNIYVGNFFLMDSTAQAAATGARIALGGKYNSAGDQQAFGTIAGLKTNSTDGNYDGYLVFSTRANGAAMVQKLKLDSAGVLSPATSDGSTLGSGTLMWSDLFLASGAVINFNNGNATITHSAGLLTSNVDIAVPDEAYDATAWNGSLEVPTKNAIRDKIESMSASSGITRSITVTSGSATMGSSASTDYVYLVAGAHTMTLPTAVSNTNRYTIKNNHSAAITVDTTSSQTIDGALSIQIAPEDSVDLISNNSNWFVI